MASVVAPSRLRVLVTGGRRYRNGRKVNDTLNELHQSSGIDCVIQGGANGADYLAYRWAIDHEIPVVTVPAKWKQLPKEIAGAERNARMLYEWNPNYVVAFPGGGGTANMVKLAQEANVLVRKVTDDD